MAQSWRLGALVLALGAGLGLTLFLRSSSRAGQVDGHAPRVPFAADAAPAVSTSTPLVDVERSALRTSRDASDAPRAGAPPPAAPPEATAPRDRSERLTLAAVCVDERGDPLERARLLAVNARSAPSADSDVHGRVKLELAWPIELRPWPFDGSPYARDQLILRFSSEDRTVHFAIAPVTEPGVIQLETARLVPAGAVRGRVLAAEGGPLEGATVYAAQPVPDLPREQVERARAAGWIPLAWGSRYEVRSDATGAYRLEGLPPETLSVWVAAAGRLCAFASPVSIVAGETVDVADLVLDVPTPEQRIEGIVHGPGGRALAGVAVIAKEDIGAGAATRLDTIARSGTDGRFVLPAAPGRRYHLVASSERDEWGVVRLPSVASGSSGVVVRFAPPRWIEVEVRTSAGSSLRGAQVSVIGESGPFGEADVEVVRGRVPAAGGPGGRWRVRVPDVPFEVGVRALDTFCRQGPFQPSQAPERLRFVFDEVARLEGTVWAESRPARGAEAHAHELGADGPLPAAGPVAVAADGGFALPLPRDGDYVLHVELDEWARGELAMVAVRGVSPGNLVELARGGSLAGRILAGADIPLLGRVVTASRGDGHVASHVVGADGAYRFELMTPGSWQIAVRRDDAAGFEATREVRIQEGVHATADIELRGALVCGVSGRLLIGGRAPAALDVNLSGDRMSRARLDGDGGFRIEAEEPGSYVLGFANRFPANSWAAWSQRIELAGGDTTWERDLPVGRVVIEGLDLPETIELEGEPDIDFALTWEEPQGLAWEAHLLAADEGSVVIGDVPAGRVALRRRPDGVESTVAEWPALLEIEVEAGSEVRVTVP